MQENQRSLDDIAVMDRFSRPLWLVHLILAILVAGLPAWRLGSTIWDGVIIEYASIIGNFAGIRTWFFDSSWFLQYYQILATDQLANLIHTSYFFMNTFITVLVLFLLSIEVAWLARELLQLPPVWQLCVSLLTVIAPVWGMLVSSVMTFHFICLYLGLLGIRLLKSGRCIRPLGWILIIASLGYPGNLMFVPVLSFFHQLNQKDSVSQQTLKRYMSSLVVLGLAITFYLGTKYFFPAEARYSGYNSMGQLMTGKGIRRFLFGGFRYATYLLPLLPAVLIHWRIKRTSASKAEPFLLMSRSSIRYLSVSLLFLSAILPFLAVGKSTFLWDVFDWDNRQAFVLIVPLVLLYGLVLSDLSQASQVRPDFSRLRNCLAAMTIILTFALLLTASHFSKINRRVFENDLISALSEIKQDLPPGRVLLLGDSPAPALRTYESNYLFYQIYGQANHWTSVVGEAPADFEIDVFLDDPNYQLQFLYQKDIVYDQNLTMFDFDATGYDSLSQIICNVFNLPNSERAIVIRSLRPA